MYSSLCHSFLCAPLSLPPALPPGGGVFLSCYKVRLLALPLLPRGAVPGLCGPSSASPAPPSTPAKRPTALTHCSLLLLVLEHTVPASTLSLTPQGHLSPRCGLIPSVCAAHCPPSPTHSLPRGLGRGVDGVALVASTLGVPFVLLAVPGKRPVQELDEYVWNGLALP